MLKSLCETQKQEKWKAVDLKRLQKNIENLSSHIANDWTIFNDVSRAVFEDQTIILM